MAVHDAIKTADPDVFGAVTDSKPSEGQKQAELYMQLKHVSETALGPGHCFVSGNSLNKTIYYNKSTAIGSAHGGGIKVPGWHIPGFRLVADVAE